MSQSSSRKGRAVAMVNRAVRWIPRHTCWLAVLVCCLPAGARAQSPAPSASIESQSVSDSEHLDLLFLAERGPLVIRLHPRLEGRSLGQVWQQYVEKLFVALDADGDERLSTKEAAGAPTPSELASAGLLTFADGRLPDDEVQNADQNPKDGMIEKKQFREYFRTIGVRSIVVEMPTPLTLEQIRQPIRPNSYHFDLLDADGDRLLSRAELKGAHAALQKYDRNHDEIIAGFELPPPLAVRSSAAPVDPVERISPFVQLGVGDDLAPLADRIVEKYDQSNDGSLTARELGWGRELFQRFDGESDGQINKGELVRFLQDPEPGLELELRLGADVAVQPDDARPAWPLDVKPVSRELLNVSLESVQIEVRAEPPPAGELNPKAYAKRTLQRNDRDKNGYLDYQEARRFRNFRTVFDTMDRDRDGKVFEEELETFARYQSELAKVLTVLTVTNQGRDLLEILDADRDMRLGHRELASAVDHIAVWDKNGDQSLAYEEIPRQFKLSLERSRPNLLQSAPLPQSRVARSASTSGAPVWFQKMDLNGDGELSRREFLGSAKRFAQFDRDGDGYIVPAEAKE